MTPSGFVLLDKIAGETSFKALFPLKRVFCTKRVGHAGTLDLRASGLIIAAVDRATRLLPYIEAKDKCYTFRLHLGYETDTLEWDGVVVNQDERRIVDSKQWSVNSEKNGALRRLEVDGEVCFASCELASSSSMQMNAEMKCAEHLQQQNQPLATNLQPLVSRAALEAVLSQFIGDIDQVPPNYCAVKINGHRASDWMERGKQIELAPRRIHIESLKIIGEGGVTEGCTGKCFVTFDLECVCSKGTYIRSLGRDLGRALGTYACVSNIRRHRIGKVSLEHAVRGDELTREHLVKVDDVLDFPVVQMNDDQIAAIRKGNWVPWRSPIEGLDEEGLLFAANKDGLVLSLCRYEPGRIWPKFYLADD